MILFGYVDSLEFSFGRLWCQMNCFLCSSLCFLWVVDAIRLLFEYILVNVRQTLEMLEKKEKVLQKKAAGEVDRAKEFTRAKNKRGMFAKCFHFSYVNLSGDFLVFGSFSQWTCWLSASRDGVCSHLFIQKFHILHLDYVDMNMSASICCYQSLGFLYLFTTGFSTNWTCWHCRLDSLLFVCTNSFYTP